MADIIALSSVIMGLVEPVDRWLLRNAVVENGREVFCVHKNSSVSPSAYA